MDKKRIFLILGFLAFTGLVGYALYWVFFKKPTQPTTTTTSTQTGQGGNFPSIGDGAPTTVQPSPTNLPINANQPTSPVTVAPSQPDIPANTTFKFDTISTVTDAPVKAMTTSGGQAKFYNSQDGKFYKLDASGNPVTLSDQVFYNVQKVTWSPNRNQSIIQYPDGAKIFYNFDTKQQVTLPKHWQDFSFAPAGEQIAAKSVGIDPNNRWLITASPDGTNVRLVEPLGQNGDKVKVDWSPNKQVVALATTGDPLSDDRQQVLLVGLNKENFRGLNVEGRGLQTAWSKQGTKLLHSVYSANSDFKPDLWIVDATPSSIGGNRKPLNLNTWASKCAMSDDRFAFCGVPETLDTGAGFAPSLADATADKLYKIDTNTGLKVEIPLGEQHTIDTVTISDDGHTLYFTDKAQAGIFKVAI